MMNGEENRPESENKIVNEGGSPPVNNTPQAAADSDAARPKRLIGSQRSPGEYIPKKGLIPIVRDSVAEPVIAVKPISETYPLDAPQTAELKNRNKPRPPKVQDDDPDDQKPDHLSRDGERKLSTVTVPAAAHIVVPKYRNGKLPEDLEEEFNAVFGGVTSDEVVKFLVEKTEATGQAVLEPDTKVRAKILSIRQDNVFLDVGTKEQGVVSFKLFPPDKEPRTGDEIEVTIVRFLAAEGLYEATVPLAAFDVRDWSQVQEGMVVEALITKTNTGGLECQVHSLRGFMPISQIDIFRVENVEPYVGQKLTCIVEEVNIERRNLVLSRKSLLLREREELRTKILSELEVGQEREGLVRKIIDSGAFVDLGGVDGFIPIGAMSWGRIRHPGDVLQEGSRVKVHIAKINEDGNRISLTYRDDASNPWTNIFERFQEKTLARGKISKITDFGAFVELMPGVEGLVHISELSNKRVNNTSDVVREGDWVDVYIASIDADKKRLALSIKQALPVDSADAETAENESVVPREPVKLKHPHSGPLKGGTGTSTGNVFGLKW